MANPLLSAETLSGALSALPAWHRDGDAIKAEFVFGDFAAAFAFMTDAAAEAERLNHHPEWSNVYNRVSVALTTHDAGGLTQSDLDLATAMSAAAATHGAT